MTSSQKLTTNQTPLNSALSTLSSQNQLSHPLQNIPPTNQNPITSIRKVSSNSSTGSQIDSEPDTQTVRGRLQTGTQNLFRAPPPTFQIPPPTTTPQPSNHLANHPNCQKFVPAQPENVGSWFGKKLRKQTTECQPTKKKNHAKIQNLVNPNYPLKPKGQTSFMKPQPVLQTSQTTNPQVQIPQIDVNLYLKESDDSFSICKKADLKGDSYIDSGRLSLQKIRDQSSLTGENSEVSQESKEFSIQNRVKIFDLFPENKFFKVKGSKRKYQVCFKRSRGGLMGRNKPKTKLTDLLMITLNIGCLLQQLEKKKYGNGELTFEQRMKAIAQYIKMYIQMFGIHFIHIQEAFSKKIQNMILEIVRNSTFEGQSYKLFGYVKDEKYQEGILTLSRFDVREGYIKDFYNDSEKNLKLQTFCQFEVYINGKWETVCLINCHLKATDPNDQNSDSHNIRDHQLASFYDFHVARGYYVTMVFGDTNLQNQKTLKDGPFFVDTYHDGSNSKNYKGTFLFHRFGVVKTQRLDRLLKSWSKEEKIIAQTWIDNNYILQGFQKFTEEQERQWFVREYGYLSYIRPSDHFALMARVRFIALMASKR